MQSAVGFAVAVGVTACTAAFPTSDLPSGEETGALRGAILLPLTTRSTDGLLGHVWSARERRVESSRHVLNGSPRRDQTRQHVEVLRRVDAVASLGASSSGVGIETAGQKRTDVAYSVDITGYETVASEATSYAPESGCCVNGVVAAACEGGCVGRVLRGSGKLRYLRRLEANASAGLGPVLHARGGMRYELLDETTFEDAFFAFVPEPLDDLCAHLAPEQEIAPIRVVASENCLIRVYTSRGQQSRLAQTTYYPTAEACWAAAARVCHEQTEAVLACPATYRDADGSIVVRELAPPAGQAASPAAPAPVPSAAAPTASPLPGAPPSAVLPRIPR